MTQEGLARLVQREGVSRPVVDAFRSVDRADFIPRGSRLEAYRDRPVGLPKEQTTSQPSLIARMIDVLGLRPGARVLEVGTGFGFQTALLATLAGDVVTIERHAHLAEAAAENLEKTGHTSVRVVVGDGWKGVPQFAPYDCIVVSAAATEVPPALAEQLADGGRMVIPVTRARGTDVILFHKRGADLVEKRLITPARFVPLIPEAPD
jgi:protein-L-isoaspartate(D-aspartate) O-methyltransferase